MSRVETAALCLVALVAGCSQQHGAVPDAGWVGDGSVDIDAGFLWREGTALSIHGRTSRPAVLLPSGVAVVSGGTDGLLGGRAVEQYDPALDRWTELALLRPRTAANHTITTLPDGRLLITSGGSSDRFNEPDNAAGTEVYRKSSPWPVVTPARRNAMV